MKGLSQAHLKPTRALDYRYAFGIGPAREGEGPKERETQDERLRYRDLCGLGQNGRRDGPRQRDGASSAGTRERGFRTMGRDIPVVHHQLPRLPDGAHGRAGVP